MKKLGVSYSWYYNKKYDKIGLDFDKDFMDNSHLNYSGAGKFTTYLGKELKSRFELPILFQVL